MKHERMRKKRLATGVLLFVMVSLSIWTVLPWIEYSYAYTYGIDYSNKGTSSIGQAREELNFNDYSKVMWSSYNAYSDFSLAHSTFERGAEIAKNNPFRVHFVESIYQFPMNERAGAEEMANRSLRCSELALAICDEIKYLKEGKYTGEEEYLKEEISRLIFSILLDSPSRTFEGRRAYIPFDFGLIRILYSLKLWNYIALTGFLIGYFVKRYGSIFAFLIGFVISIYHVATCMTLPTMEIPFLLELFFMIWIWAGLGPGFIGYGASVLGRRIREGEKPFLNKKELIGLGVISTFTIGLVLTGIVLPPYYPPRLYPQIYSSATYGSYLIMPLTAFLYGFWSKERHGIMSFMIAYFPLFVMGSSGLEGSWLCFPIGVLLGLAGLAGWFVSKMRSAKSV